MICNPFTGQTSEGVISMRYSFEFKMNAVDLYRQGKWSETPEDISTRRFHKIVRQWVRKYKVYGYDGLINQTGGRKPKESSTKKKIDPTPLTSSRNSGKEDTN